MKINLHIERLVLEGLPLDKRHGSQVQAAITAELTRLLQAQGLAHELRSAGVVPYRPTPAIQVDKTSQPSQIGQQIAQSVYGSIGRAK